MIAVGVSYLLTILSMATIGVIVPSMANFSARLAASQAEIGFAIALFSVPSAVLATIGGGLIDQIGPKRALLLSAAIAVAGDGIAYGTTSLFVFDIALLMAGVAFAGISVAAPALLIGVLQGGARIRAMSFWSTYAPTGFAIGLLLAAPFADGADWRMAMLAHAALIGVAGIAALALPAHISTERVRQSAAARVADMFSVLRELPVVRLAIAVALPNAISYGTSLVAPSYLAEVYDLSVAASSSTVAFAKIFAMIVGGLAMGHLLARNVSSRLLFAGMAAIGILAQWLLYMPASGFPLATCALIVWLFAFGGMSGTAMALLPSVIRDPARGGAASGLVGQFISIASFAAPSIYFAMPWWPGFVLIAGAGLAVALLALPMWNGQTAKPRV